MNRSLPRFCSAGMTALLFLLAAVSPMNAGIAHGPQITNSVDAEQKRIMQFFDAEYSYQQKLRVGKERYVQRQAERAKVVAGMAAQLKARQQLFVSPPRSDYVDSTQEQTDWYEVSPGGAVFLLSLIGIFHRFYRKALEDSLALTNPQIPEPDLGPAPAPEPEVVVPSIAEAIFACRAFGADARGRSVEAGFLVLRGSIGIKNSNPSTLTKAYETLCAKLLESGVLRDLGDKFVFEKDHVFSSPSPAATVVMGTTANGWLDWRTEDGITLDRVERQRR